MITQVRFSSSVKFFEQDFCARWNVRTYYDQSASCLFAGVYSTEDVRVINAHKGFKVVWNNGHVRPFFTQLNPKNMVVLKYTDSIDHSILGNKYKMKRARFEIKDYSLFKPSPLGDCVCCYLGTPALSKLYGRDEVTKLMKKVKYSVLISYLGMTRTQLKEQIYDRCFVYFKPIMVGGVETANELALMGRQTISNAKGEYYIPYTSIDHACELIEKEAVDIGKTRNSVLPSDYFDTGKEWMDENFWL
jgi:hypothetical protein